jgi:hypothetical protein
MWIKVHYRNIHENSKMKPTKNCFKRGGRKEMIKKNNIDGALI